LIRIRYAKLNAAASVHRTRSLLLVADCLVCSNDVIASLYIGMYMLSACYSSKWERHSLLNTGQAGNCRYFSFSFQPSAKLCPPPPQLLLNHTLTQTNSSLWLLHAVFLFGIYPIDAVTLFFLSISAKRHPPVSDF
jgi:hypothetical protein